MTFHHACPRIHVQVRFPSNVPEEGVTRLCFVTLPPDFTLVFGFFKHTANLWKVRVWVWLGQG